VEASIEQLEVAAFTVPAETVESDGTARWDSTTMILVELRSGDCCGIGYTYGDGATATLIDRTLRELVEGADALAVTALHERLARRLRNLGRAGLGSMAIAAIDCAAWDLKARLLELPLAVLLGKVRDAVPVYGSGGFTNYSLDELADQLAGWAAEGIARVKMKVGREPERDIERVSVAREAVGGDVELFVDANGALSRKQALWFAGAYRDFDVRWFEEPVSSDDLEGLRFLRDNGPAGMDIAAGEYGYTLPYFERMLAAGAVDCLQADATRCEGITGFLAVDALCRARSLELSAHTAPSLHAHVCCAVHSVRHVEYFFDHVRIERLLFDGVLEPENGRLVPDLTRPGNGLELKREEADCYAA
jgi:L-alanine-DL-glutamate epimerase-like enolase superfamily enzyme